MPLTPDLAPDLPPDLPPGFLAIAPRLVAAGIVPPEDCAAGTPASAARLPASPHRLRPALSVLSKAA